MASPTFYQPKTFFYPIGNTSAACLTEYLAAEDDVHGLLLGCGDPRNILFTIYNDKSSKFSRTFDFTCCDIDPAVLGELCPITELSTRIEPFLERQSHDKARNALLLSLIADGHFPRSFMQVWDIFFNFYIDASSLALLLSQCKKLCALSNDLDTWNNSDYGAFIRLCSRQTLLELHKCWTLYVKTEKQSKSERKRQKEKLASSLKKHGTAYNLSLCRSAGIFYSSAASVLGEYSARYWDTGLCPDNPERLAAAINVNPTFVYSFSGEEFAVHYGTHPFAIFHLAAALNTKQPAKVDIRHVENVAMNQFRSWCEEFQVSLKVPGRVIVRLFAGDAIAFGHALRFCSSHQDASIYSSPWRATRLQLDGGDYGSDPRAPVSFNVIDTSNLLDHVGLMNILIITAPLLANTPSSTLYTETLLPLVNDPDQKFLNRLCGDVTVLSLLFGIAPLYHMSGFTTRSNMQDILMSGAAGELSQFYERIPWKKASISDVPIASPHARLAFDPSELSRFLFDVYLQMFSDEDVSSRLSNPERAVRAYIHYVRGTFSAFLQIVKEKAEVDWNLVMDNLYRLIVQDRTLLVGSNYIQDLFCQFHMAGVYTVDVLLHWQEMLKPNMTKGIYRGWSHVPPVVCIVLIVPRNRLRALDDFHFTTPILQCDIKSAAAHNTFPSIHTSFGEVSLSGRGENRRIAVREDKTKWKGSSPLVVSFWVPAWLLIHEQLVKSIGLSVRSTPGTSPLLPKLGLSLSLFSTELSDIQHVYVLRERPTDTEPISVSTLLPASGEAVLGLTVRASLDSSCKTLSSLTYKVDIVDPGARSALLRGADVPTEQVSPYVIKFSIGDFREALEFPLPINGNRCRIRVARKSHYIEVVAIPHKPLRAGGLSILNFPVIVQRGCLAPWNIHRVNLDQLPPLEVSSSEFQSSLDFHLSTTFSDLERSMKDQGSEDVFVDMKITIVNMFSSFVGVHGRKHRSFVLTDQSTGAPRTLFLFTELRLDLASYTFVADGYVLPLSEELLQDPVFVEHFSLSTERGVAMKMRSEAYTAWKHLIPALVERCRQWSHNESCEYKLGGKTSVSLESTSSLICHCGRGKGTDALLKINEWRGLIPYVTRIAIGPLFAVSYLEKLAAVLDGLRVKEARDKCAMCRGDGKPKLRFCSKCKRVQYCSEACQREDWGRHKASCKK